MKKKTINQILMSALIVPALFFASFSYGQAQDVSEAFKVYKDAKMAIYGKQWNRAVELLKQFKERFPQSQYIDDSLYWMVYSLEISARTMTDKTRAKTTLKEALRVADLLINNHPTSSWVDDVSVLKIKILAQLVSLGQQKYLTHIEELIEGKSAGEQENGVRIVALDTLLNIAPKRALPYAKKLLDDTNKPEQLKKLTFMLSHSKNKEVRKLFNRLQLEKPVWVKKVDPVFPIEALRQKVQGDVLLEVTTDPAGNVVKAKVIKGHSLLHQAAINAIKQWKHEPTPVEGQQISRIFTVTITFELY